MCNFVENKNRRLPPPVFGFSAISQALFLLIQAEPRLLEGLSTMYQS
jgi:hypothetical protein